MGWDGMGGIKASKYTLKCVCVCKGGKFINNSSSSSSFPTRITAPHNGWWCTHNTHTHTQWGVASCNLGGQRGGRAASLVGGPLAPVVNHENSLFGYSSRSPREGNVNRDGARRDKPLMSLGCHSDVAWVSPWCPGVVLCTAGCAGVCKSD